jgi:hypothetical protein
MNIDELRKLKPRPGDVVLFENHKYVVIDVGMRYLHAYKLGGNPNVTFLIRMRDAIKIQEKVNAN